MEKEEFQKKYDNSIIVYNNDTQIGGVFNICDSMNLTASKSKQVTAILIGEQTAKARCSTWNNSSMTSIG